jgi:hypothetical protein
MTLTFSPVVVVIFRAEIKLDQAVTMATTTTTTTTAESSLEIQCIEHLH